MPALTNSDATILVTGGNGFIAKWIVGEFLEKGYNVRASVRTLDKGQVLQDLFKSYGTRLQLVEVGDMRAVSASWILASPPVPEFVRYRKAHLMKQSKASRVLYMPRLLCTTPTPWSTQIPWVRLVSEFSLFCD